MASYDFLFIVDTPNYNELFSSFLNKNHYNFFPIYSIIFINYWNNIHNLVDDNVVSDANMVKYFTDNKFSFSNVENIQSLYHYSIPNVRLYYPEPYIASPSFLHNDI
jgi:hypothetical protein